MSDLLALLDAVRSDPGDDLARGVLADWLDDHGDPRAAVVRTSSDLIRILAELDALPDPHAAPGPVLEDQDDPYGPLSEENRRRWEEFYIWQEDAELRLRECGARYDVAAAELDDRYRAWLRSRPPELAALGFDFETFCGFVDAVHARVSMWRRIRPAAVAPHPVRDLYLTAGPGIDTPPRPDTDVPLPQLRTLTVSYRRGQITPGDSDLDFVRACRQLGEARTLALDLAHHGGHLLRWAARSLPLSRHPCLPAVRLIPSPDDAPPYDDVLGLCRSPLVERLESLDLGLTLAWFTPERAAAILELPFGTVTTLTASIPEPDTAVPNLARLLDAAAARWAAEGRELRYRAAEPAEPHPAERVLRAYWSAADFGWVAPPRRQLYYRDDDDDRYWYPEPDPWDDATDADRGITPTRRELYRGRFRNPRPR